MSILFKKSIVAALAIGVVKEAQMGGDFIAGERLVVGIQIEGDPSRRCA